MGNLSKLSMFAKDDFSMLTNLTKSNMSTFNDTKVKKSELKKRMNHSIQVAEISDMILNSYYKDTNPHFTDMDMYLLKIMKKNHVEFVPKMLGIIHDTYKYCENQYDHGEIISKQFELWVLMVGIEISPEIQLMIDALKKHSNKNLNDYDNLYYKILCDADILSRKYIMKVDELKDKNGFVTFKDYEKSLDFVKDYTPKTPYFNIYLHSYQRQLKDNISLELEKVGKKKKKG